MLKEIEEKGYTIVKGVFTKEKVNAASTLFYDWVKTVPETITRDTYYGIIKTGEVGHQKHAWYVKTDPMVQAVFRELWNTDDLVTAFDAGQRIQLPILCRRAEPNTGPHLRAAEKVD